MFHSTIHADIHAFIFVLYGYLLIMILYFLIEQNIFVLGVIAVGFLGFLQYQKSQGRKVQVGDKKLN